MRAMRPAQTRYADPAPSRWAWRIQRLLLTPGFKFSIRVILPLAVVLGGAGVWFADQGHRQVVSDKIAELRASFEARPEFRVHLMAISGADDAVAQEIREVLPFIFPMSSFDLDLEDIRQTISELPPVKSASLRIKPGGVLQIDVLQRTPAMVWRNREGLVLVDDQGEQVTTISARTDRKDLPLIVGAGAAEHVGEALDLYAAAGPVEQRLRGLVRVGERRWDVVLDRDQRILLPETGAVEALERVIALDHAQDVLSRDVARVDMRLSERPTIRMNEGATQEWWQIKSLTRQ